MKRCCRCKENKDESAFHMERAQKDGRCRACKTCCSESRKRHYRQHLDEYHQYNRQMKATVLAAYGNRCACCGEDRKVFLAIDHIGGGGNAHRKKIRKSAGSGFYLWLKSNNYPEGFRVLCHNCNFATRMGKCPHEEERG